MLKQSKLSGLVILVIAALACAFSGGDGTTANPYQISTRADLEAMNNNLAAHYILINDIDLADTTYTNAVIASSSGTTGTFVGTKFTGSFNGNGFIIKNLTISAIDKYFIGLFGYNHTGAMIKNLGIVDCSILGKSYVGGLIGLNFGTVSNCYSTGSINGGSNTGGLVGYNAAGTVSNCYSAGLVTGSGNIGGLVGNNATGVTGHCYSTSLVSGGNNAGGLVGSNSSGMVIYCYSTGSISGSSNIGGLVGNNSSGTVLYSYSTGFLQAAGSSIGGLVGYGYGTVRLSCWDIETSGITTSSGGTGKTTVEMKNQTTYTGWNFSGLWAISDGEGYPTLGDMQNYSQPRDVQLYQLAGNGSVATPYIITNADELNAIRKDLNAHYCLSNNIDLAHSAVWDNFFGWQPIGTNIAKFNGTFDGNGFAIKNLTISRLSGDNVGFFGYISNSAVIKNVGIENAAIIGKKYVGGLVGYNDYGTINNCYSTGLVIGNSTIGGLVGENSYGKIRNCYSSVTTRETAGTNAGGLIGHNDSGTVSLCYSTGNVSGNYNTGGLVGESIYGTIAYCYSTGKVSGNSFCGGLAGSASSELIKYSFWDTQTSGQTISDGGTGKTTAQMKMQATYTGWNFNALWTINEGVSYPTLRIEGNYSLPQDVNLSSLSGSGTVDNPYIITNANELNAVRKDLNAHYRLGNDIDLIDSVIWDNFQGWLPIGTNVAHFKGSFDGNGFTISNLAISREINFVGLFGCIGSGTEVKNVSIENAVIAGLTDVGCLVGRNYGTLSLCRSSGQVVGSDYVGGVIGYNASDYTVSCIYSTAAVSGKSYIGGLIGYNSASTYVSYCYSTGYVDGSYCAGGLVGYNPNGLFNACFWDINTSGKTTSAGGTGKTTVEMKLQSTYKYWNFSALWAIDEGVSYPTLRDIQNYSLPRDVQLSELAGSGTIDDPYILTNADELNSVRKDLNAHYRLGNDIDLIDSFIWNDFLGWEPIGTQTNNFMGTFDGGGFAIRNFTISRQETPVGLFGCIGLNAAVKNLGIENTTIKGMFYVGGLVGYNRGNVTRCYSTGSVIGSESVGGLVGYNYSGGTVKYCYSTSVTSGIAQWIGGLIGLNKGSIIYCYSTGAVDGNRYVAGLVGSNTFGTVSYCYSTGLVAGNGLTGGLAGQNFYGTIISCFWDTETSGQATDTGGIGLTTAQMQTQSTFINAGWDFINETTNGQMDAWYMEADDYPLLYWQAAKGDVNYDGILNESDLRVMISQWLMAAQTNQRLSADIDDNGVVDLADFSILSYALTYIGADFNRDGIIDEHDLVILASDWLAHGQQLSGDINNDGVMDMADFAVLADQWLTRGGM